MESICYAREIAKYNPKHIHIHFATKAANVAYVVGNLEGISYSITTHGYDVFVQPSRNYKQLSSNSSTIFGISDYSTEYLIENHSLERSKTRTSYCGVFLKDYTYFSYTYFDTSLPITVLTVARLHPVKGHELLLEAISRIKANTSYRFQLLFAGDGELRNILAEKAKQLNLENEVSFLGEQSQDNVLDLIRRAHIFILPSLSEGLPISLMEAMAGFLPVIGPDINGVPELIIDNETGVLFQPGNSEDLQKKILYLISNPDLAKGLAENAKERVVDKFDIEKNVVLKFENLTSRTFPANLRT